MREEYVEYILLGQLCSHAWSRGRLLEIARASTDAFGYDVILGCIGVIRHLQLKASKFSASTHRQAVAVELTRKPSGCVLWVEVDEVTLAPMRFLRFGSSPGDRLPDVGDKIPRNTRAKAEGVKGERPNHRVLAKGQFEPLADIPSVFIRLFG